MILVRVAGYCIHLVTPATERSMSSDNAKSDTALSGWFA